MIQLKDIQIHDLIYVVENDSDCGWFIITELSRRRSFVVAHPLGDMDRRIYIPEEEAGLILKHLRITGFPVAAEALEDISAGKTITSDGMVQCMVMYEAQEIAESAIRAVRGEETT